jgi:glutathionylspermidine synthase
MSAEYVAYARKLSATNVLSDPWICGEPRFREAPVVLRCDERDTLYRAAEDVAVVYDELCRICAAEPRHIEGFFGLTPFQKLMWLASAPAWHGIARADVFRTAEGLKICELNCDTPSGEAEAVLTGPIAREARPDLADPNGALLARFCEMIRAVLPDKTARAPRIGIVYPTEMSEDLSMIELYRRAFTDAGWRVAIGSPFNLEDDECGRALLLGEPCDVLVRHYKTDWWGEREPAWDDAEPVPDTEPLRDALASVLRASLGGKAAVVNPFGAVLPQNKRAMAFMWEEKARFSPWAQDAIERLVPETRRLETMSRADLTTGKDAWVIKSDYGCEGAEVLLGAALDDAEWAEALAHAKPGRWIAQRRFAPLVETEEGESINYGIYVVAGEACGVLSRLQSGMTDRFARTAPTLVELAS